MSKYSQGICDDGAAILEDGVPLTVEEIVETLNMLNEELIERTRNFYDLNKRLTALMDSYAN